MTNVGITKTKAFTLYLNAVNTEICQYQLCQLSSSIHNNNLNKHHVRLL